ncbi:hypothetical protein AMATHDRAFT_52986 [Amanita thiersii Skay4041]|uniref:1-phosphatidylinositol 4-kinase n=1 Tax=Amanita thiersii Skay4041 TaxID=703135 RepID=A0A2A9P0S0_9AGAR|nr:hypothetical protein AMATHDRAFT_52986 [Amanita thiersii Skay4041]
MDCLELNIHQRILSDLALISGESLEDASYAQQLVLPRVHKVERQVLDVNGGDKFLEEPRVYMSSSSAHCNVAFGDMIVNFPGDYIEGRLEIVLPILVDLLTDIPRIDFDRNLSWIDWSLPDQLVFSTVSALLRITSSQPGHSNQAIAAILSFISATVENIRTSTSLDLLTQLAPELHGLYRAISSTPYPWSITQWKEMTTCLQVLCSQEIVDRLNTLLNTLVKEDNDPEILQYTQTFLTRYVSQGRPLSGFFMVCCVIETEWTVLAQTLAPPSVAIEGYVSEAAAANKAWISLMMSAAVRPNINEDIAECLHETGKYAMQCFSDLLVQIEEMEGEPSMDTYSWETMSESLKLATISSVVLGEMNEKLYSRLLQLLSRDSPVSDNLVQEAALKATTVLAQSFPEIALKMVTHLRHFITSPLPIFEYEFASETRAPPPLVAAAKCLALCIKLAPGDDLMMSVMYSLLNYIAATSKELYETSSAFFSVPFSQSLDTVTYPLERGLRGLSEEQRRMIGISVISVVTKLALEFRTDEVTRLTVSMLLQRFRYAEPTVEAAIAYNLVDLALVSPTNTFVEIIRQFSTINRSANPDDPRFSNNMVLAAQTRLAQELQCRPELFEIYLVELLTLFADKGVAIQNVKIVNRQINIDDMIEQLGSLLLPIDALLSHPDFNPQNSATMELVRVFRSMWFLCVLFSFTNNDHKHNGAMEWLLPALGRIALKTPNMVFEESHELVASDVEFNSVVRQEYASSALHEHRELLAKHMGLRAYDLRHLSSGQIIFILVMHDMETMRSTAGLTSSLVSYFINDSLNQHPDLSACMDAVADKVIRGCIEELLGKVSQQALPQRLFSELQFLLISVTHRVAKAREVALKFLNRLMTSLPSLLCHLPFIFSLLDVLTMLKRSCENEFVDEYNPIYEYRSERTGITLELTDNYKIRNDILDQLLQHARSWLKLAINRAPSVIQSTLQKYLALNQTTTCGIESSELGASLAEEYGKAVDPVQAQLASLASMIPWVTDAAKSLAGQIANKAYFTGESSGLRLARSLDKLDQLAPESSSMADVTSLKQQMDRASEGIREKTSTLTVHDLRRLLFRCAALIISMDNCDYDLLHRLVVLPFEVGTPTAVAAGIEVWIWLIADKPNIEIALLAEIVSGWTDSIVWERGLFSSSMNYEDPFTHPTEYSPTDKDVIDRGLSNARRLLTPHTLVLHMLSSRLQAARYGRPNVMFLMQQLVARSSRANDLFSTHALSREPRFTFLIFGMEMMRSSYLDAFCENMLRESLYATAYGWFAARPQWTYGANRASIQADIRILSDFLSQLQTDKVQGYAVISSLSPVQLATRGSYYKNRIRTINTPLRMLVENEISRLMVWSNPTNDARKGGDYLGVVERTQTEASWMNVVRTVWGINPAIAIHLPERFKNLYARIEVGKLVRSNTLQVLDVPEALPFLLGERLDLGVPRDLKYLFLWTPVPPMTAISLFERRFKNDPLILQYAHRVMEQHPVELTFFFVPQVVQALRYDDLGYVARFIFETAKLSQLFCHQIIWNMKANCYKGDAAEVEDSLKPVLDRMTERVVDSLSGEARAFYDREFTFFNEVTSISGKLKPFIKKTKPEKKAKIDEEMAKVVVDVGVYLPSNPDGVVVDIDKKSGRPLQSHAKAPFMATFKVRKERIVVDTNPDSLLNGDGGGEESREQYDVWQQAIFKVGDDCRQDVLALQVIAMFKSIFTSVGLTLYLFPYRVNATGPGSGVIDVVPNATSRDEMGRAKVNDLLDFFIAKYGGPDTVAFQRARLNFIQSMAAYSVACYVLQIKDRHNGNIMIDGEGHIVHVDFGFLFDIDMFLPYDLLYLGVKFEPNSFKLNHEMIVLMGGRNSQGYQMFQNLTVKAFLAIRPHAEQIINTVQLMLDTGLPSFKGEPTIRRLRDRFALHLTDRQAADEMMHIIRNAYENIRSTAYDEFQRKVSITANY